MLGDKLNPQKDSGYTTSIGGQGTGRILKNVGGDVYSPAGQNITTTYPQLQKQQIQPHSQKYIEENAAENEKAQAEIALKTHNAMAKKPSPDSAQSYQLLQQSTMGKVANPVFPQLEQSNFSEKISTVDTRISEPPQKSTNLVISAKETKKAEGVPPATRTHPTMPVQSSQPQPIPKNPLDIQKPAVAPKPVPLSL